jgi:hypothetical protein
MHANDISRGDFGDRKFRAVLFLCLVVQSSRDISEECRRGSLIPAPIDVFIARPRRSI